MVEAALICIIGTTIFISQSIAGPPPPSPHPKIKKIDEKKNIYREPSEPQGIYVLTGEADQTPPCHPSAPRARGHLWCLVHQREVAEYVAPASLTL